MCAIVVCYGLNGLPDAIGATWPLAVVRTRALHLIRNALRLVSRARWEPMVQDLRPVYTARTEAAVQERFEGPAEIWGDKHPAIIPLWHNARAEGTSFPDCPTEVRRSSTPPTPSNPSTSACAAPPAPAVTSPTDRIPPNDSTS